MSDEPTTISRRDAVRLAAAAAALGVTIGVDPRRLLAQPPTDGATSKPPAGQQKKRSAGDAPSKEFAQPSGKSVNVELKKDIYENTPPKTDPSKLPTVQEKLSSPNEVTQVKVRGYDPVQKKEVIGGTPTADPKKARAIRPDLTPAGEEKLAVPGAAQMKRGESPATK